METFLDLLTIFGLFFGMLLIGAILNSVGETIAHYYPSSRKYVNTLCKWVILVLAVNLFWGSSVGDGEYFFNDFVMFLGIFLAWELGVGLKGRKVKL